MIAQGGNAHVFRRTAASRVHNVRTDDVPTTPLDVVAQDDKLHPRQAAGEVSHRSVEVVRFGKTPAEFLQALGDVIASTDVDNNSHEVESLPFGRRLRVEKTVSLLDDVRFEG